ncbi:MAG TPA: methyltransferase domain-containing protein [Candidatus Limnocylindrales bacterium]|nr:methyltransferase domain-containing protein [Candidatus Limnocylindrales bacterium]
MVRVDIPELLEDATVPSSLVERAYQDMAAVHYWLGDVRYIVRTIRRDPAPVRRILDVGCGPGLVAHRVAAALGVEAVGADIRRPFPIATRIPVVQADACQDLLPRADVAFCMSLCHHLPPEELAALIRNVGRSCRRLVMLDLVRRYLPLALFKLFVAPFLCRIDAEDGARSLRRAYTPAELASITSTALAGTGATFTTNASPFGIRQVVDIRYAQRPVGKRMQPRQYAGEQRRRCQ